MHMEKLLTVDETAEILGVSTKTIRRRVSDGTIRKASIGGRAVRISAAEIARICAGVSVSVSASSIEKNQAVIDVI
jgi:excisionase family DNA binding protein